MLRGVVEGYDTEGPMEMSSSGNVRRVPLTCSFFFEDFTGIS